PRQPVPINYLSLARSGATVKEQPASGLAIATSQTRRPLVASTATRWASIVPMNNVSPRIATPRLIRPQHGRDSGAGRCEYTQNVRPVVASRATRSFGAWTVYM